MYSENGGDIYRRFRLCGIRPEGGARCLLETYASGLLGNLEDFWPDVGPENGWLGGDGDDWERGPYYLDGLIPAAFLLDDEKLESRAENWIRHAFASQASDGNFGPERNTDWWPRMVMLKAVIEWADAKADPALTERTVEFIGRYFDFFMSEIDERPFEFWAYVRGCEFLHSVIWLHRKTDDPKWLAVGRKILDASLDWKPFFRDLPFRKPTENYLHWKEYEKWVEDFCERKGDDAFRARRWEDPYFLTYLMSHGVNIAMAVKYPAYEWYFTHEEGLPELIHTGYGEIMRCHGQANAMWSCDEHLNGTCASRGTELCTVVEFMFSLEETMMITGDFSWADTLDKVAMNALPGAISKDGCRHQYDQSCNQISCTNEERNYYNNHSDSNIFGLEPNFGCCTANMHQGLPKYLASSWVRKDDELVCLSYTSSLYEEDGWHIAVDSDYPVSGKVTVSVKADRPMRMALSFRIPSWCRSWKASGKYAVKDGFIVYEDEWFDERIGLEFVMAVEMKEASGGHYLMRGPVIFSLPLKSEEKVVVDRGRFSDMELRTDDAWAYAFEKDSLDRAELDGMSLTLPMKEVTDWSVTNHEASPVPSSPGTGEERTVTLVPYGRTDLRMTVFPLV